MSISKLVSKNIYQFCLLGLLFLCQSPLFGQCPEEAGLYCDPTVENGAPIMCDLECLDGFSATMPDSLYEPQPEFLCELGGTANNMSWFAFVAGSDSISLTVTPSDCNTITSSGGTTFSNIQAGIFESCDLDDRAIVCHNPCNGDDKDNPGPATLSVGGIIPGQTYYFFVDGCNGTVCDYTITVNYGNQPFDINEPTNITSTQINNGESVCTGFNNLDLRLNGVTPGVNYHWRIDPPIEDMPDTDADGIGEWPSTSMDSISIGLEDPGTYSIYGFSDNDCDRTDSVYFTVLVEDLDTVVFDSVQICAEEFGSYIGPFQLFDGEPESWSCGPISAPGWNYCTVNTLTGCTYEQKVYVSPIPSPREPVDVFVCNGQYPIDYNGITFNGPGDAGFYVMGKASTGCDSMVDISLIDVTAGGSFAAGDCENGNASIIFTLTSVLPDTYSAITYEWYDENGLVTDADGVDTILEISSSGRYSLRAIITNNGEDCEIVVGEYEVDIDAIRPSTPVFINPASSFCQGETTQSYSLATDGTESAVDWFLVGDNSATFENSANITFDWSSTNAREICVSTINNCGISDTVCHVVDILPIPEVSFESPDTICVTESLLVNYTGDLNAFLSWNTDGGVLVESTPSEFLISWTVPGSYEIALNGSLNGCSDTLLTKSIEVEGEPMVENFNCQASADRIDFSWSPSDCATSYVLDTNGVVVYQGLDLSYSFEDLPEGKEINANLTLVSDCACPSSIAVQSSCVALGCPSVDIDISGEFGVICEEEVAPTIQYSVNVIGGDPSLGSGVWSGDYIDSNGLFETALSPGGPTTFYYTYIEDACEYRDSIQVNIASNPDLSLDIDDPDCYNDSSGYIDLSASGGSGFYTFYINGDVVADLANVELPEGDYDVMVMDNQNCGDQELVQITIPDEPELIINGVGDIVEGSTDVLSINTSAFIDNIIDSILWMASDGTVVCSSPDCESVTVSPTVPTNYLVTVYYDGGCNVRSSYSLMVRPETRIVFPSIFAPAGNNPDNHFFKVGTNNPNLEVFNFQVFNRWGERMFNAENVLVSSEECKWDGRYKGQIVPPGVYVYTFKAKDGDREILRKGSVTIFR
jgi:hypothetical protein